MLCLFGSMLLQISIITEICIIYHTILLFSSSIIPKCQLHMYYVQVTSHTSILLFFLIVVFFVCFPQKSFKYLQNAQNNLNTLELFKSHHFSCLHSISIKDEIQDPSLQFNFSLSLCLMGSQAGTFSKKECGFLMNEADIGNPSPSNRTCQSQEVYSAMFLHIRKGIRKMADGLLWLYVSPKLMRTGFYSCVITGLWKCFFICQA